MGHISFIHSFVDGHLSCFCVLAIVNSAAMNTGVHVSFRIMVFSGYMPSNGIAGSQKQHFWNTFYQYLLKLRKTKPTIQQFTLINAKNINKCPGTQETDAGMIIATLV